MRTNTPNPPRPTPPGAPGRPPRRASRYSLQLPPWLSGYAAWIALGLVVLVSGVLAYVLWTLRDLPDPGRQTALARSVVVFDRKGRQIEQRNAKGEYYHVVHLRDMGKVGPAATLAAEDREFYHHGAVDYPATARAAVQDLIHGGYEQGGSTITQQLIKVSVLTPQKSIFRKLQEAVLATALEQRYTKDEILELYLNRVYYGHSAYGLGAATKVYFGRDKEPRDLTAGQAAFLAGLINAPTYYDPQTHYDRAKARQLYVLRGMVTTHALSQDEADRAAQEDVKAQLKFDASLRQSQAPHFVDYVVGQLERQYGSAAVQQGGFAIYTTLDLDLQRRADQAVKSGVSKLRGGGINNGMLLAAKPDTGEILAWIGSADYYNDSIGGQFNVVTSPRQPGSSFKPYVYEAALKDHKLTLASTLHDKPTDFGGGYRPLDFDNAFMGDMSARRALLLSRNVPAVETGQKEGMAAVINLARAVGIRSELKDVPSTAIGASEVTMYEHLQGYQTFANQGTKMPLMSITRIVDTSGNTLFDQKPGQQEGRGSVLSPAEAFLITDVLKDYNRQWALGWNRLMAAKSGTTGGSATGVHRDAWMMAYNPDIVVGAWGGNTAANGEGKPISTFGTEVGEFMLGAFINTLPDSYRDWYRRPEGLVDGSGCPGDRTSGGRELFLAGTERGIECAPAPSPTPSATPTAPPSTPTPTPPPTPTPSATPRGLPSGPQPTLSPR